MNKIHKQNQHFVENKDDFTTLLEKHDKPTQKLYSIKDTQADIKASGHMPESLFY